MLSRWTCERLFHDVFQDWGPLTTRTHTHSEKLGVYLLLGWGISPFFGHTHKLNCHELPMIACWNKQTGQMRYSTHIPPIKQLTTVDLHLQQGWSNLLADAQATRQEEQKNNRKECFGERGMGMPFTQLKVRPKSGVSFQGRTNGLLKFPWNFCHSKVCSGRFYRAFVGIAGGFGVMSITTTLSIFALGFPVGLAYL
jgi:hypothetical protein